MSSKKPIKKNRGSAIFLHVAKKKFKPTLGCIALSKNNLRYLISVINKKTYLKILEIGDYETKVEIVSQQDDITNIDGKTVELVSGSWLFE